jgi:Fe-S-cluster containining protein
MPDAARAADYDCLKCGACCASPSPGESYVRLDAADIRRLEGTGLPILQLAVQGAEPPETVEALGTKSDPHGTRVCAALNGCAGGANACSVYERRPGACRSFEVGGLFCRIARQRFGLPV